MVTALGGPADFIATHTRHLKPAPIVRPVHAEAHGKVASIRTRELGLAVIELGGGRRVASDAIDHRVGLSRLLGKGARADGSTPLCLVHAADEDSFAKAAEIVRKSYVLGDEPCTRPSFMLASLHEKSIPSSRASRDHGPSVDPACAG